MNKKKYIGHISISIILIIAFITITILFSTLFKATSESLHTQATVELGALEPGKSDRTESVGTECSGGTAYADPGNLNSLYIVNGFFCIEHNGHIVSSNFFSASNFIEKLNQYTSNGFHKEINPPIELKNWEDNLGVDTVPGHSYLHVNVNDYYKSIPGYTLGRYENSAWIRSNAFYECTGDHRELSPKMAYIVTSGADGVTKQVAIWADPNEQIGPVGKENDLSIEADAYADYDAQIRSR